MKKNLLYICLALLISILILTFTAACSRCSLSSEEDIYLEEDEGKDLHAAGPGDTIVTYIDSPGIGEIAISIAVPEIPRYSEGAPIVFDVSTWFVPLAGFT